MVQTPLRASAGTLAGLGQIAAERGEPLSATLTRVVRDRSVSAELVAVDAWYATMSDEDRTAVAA